MKYQKPIVIFILFTLISGFICQTLLPRLLSFQDQLETNSLENYLSKDEIAIFNNKKINVPNSKIEDKYQILGESTEKKRIEVDLTNQRLYAYEGNNLIFNFLISSGKWDRTPTGVFKIWAKVPKQKMSGGSKELGTYYYLPNVPYILFFYNDKVAKKVGYSIHGTYWHDNFGVPMSHGCINMKTSEVAQVYPWADKETEIIIYGKYQNKKISSVNKSTSTN